MKFAYADPPYLGQGKKHYSDHPEAHVWDSPKTHQHLIRRLRDEYPDGWALSASSPSLAPLNITLKKGLVGAKPPAFCEWILDLLGWEPGDQLDDLFPGTGVMAEVVEWREKVA